MPPGYEDWIKEFMKQNEKLMKKIMTPSSGFPPMPPMPPMPGFPPMPPMPSFPPMPGMPGFCGSNGGFGGFPGVGAFSDGTNGPQTSTSFGELNWNSEKDEPGKKSWTSPDANSFINISVDYGDGDWEDPFEGEGKTGVGGFGDPDPASGSAPPRRKRPGRWQNDDEDTWDGREGSRFRDKEDGEEGGGRGGGRGGGVMVVRGRGERMMREVRDHQTGDGQLVLAAHVMEEVLATSGVQVAPWAELPLLPTSRPFTGILNICTAAWAERISLYQHS